MADTDTIAPVAPVAPSPTVATAPPAAAPPPASPPPLSTLNEKASQLAGSISSQPQFEAALGSIPGAAALPPDAKGQLWDTVQKTRVGQGLPPMTIAAPGGPPGGAPVAGGQTPVTPAVTAALPPSVTGAPSSAPAGNAPTAGNAPPPAAPPPANPLAQTVPPAPTAASLGLQTPQDNGPIDPATGKPMAAPQQKDVQFTPAKYQPPKKGLLYAAAAIALLFPGSQIGKAAGSFVQGLNSGAQQKYQRDEQTAEQKFAADKSNAQTDYQNASTKYGAASEQAHRAYLNLQTANGAKLDEAEAGWKSQVAALAQKQNLYIQGLGPNGKPIPPPPALAKPLGPKAGAADYAAHETALANWYNTNGMTGPGAQHAASATEYQKQVSAEATQAAELQRTMMTINAGYARTNATINAAAARQDAQFREQFAVLDAHERDGYRTEATRSNQEASKLWAGLTTPITDGFGQTKPAIVPDKELDGSPGKLKQSITAALNGMTKGQGRYDPQGYAQYIIDNTPSLKDNPIAQQVLSTRADALTYTMRSNGYQPVPFIAPPKLDSSVVLKHAGVNPADPNVKAWRAQATAANIDPDSPEAIAAMKHDLGSGGGARPSARPVAPAAPPDAAHKDAPILGVASGIQHVLGTAGSTKQDPEAAARTAGLTPGTPAWNNYLRTHGQ